MTDTELRRKSRPRKYEPVKGFDEPFTEVLQKASISKNRFDLAMLPELTAINVEAALERRKFFSDRAKVRPAQAPLMHRIWTTAGPIDGFFQSRMNRFGGDGGTEKTGRRFEFSGRGNQSAGCGCCT